MKDHLAELVRQAATPAQGRNLAREYLQARILAAMQRAGAMIPLAFHGGTALRFLYAHGRYSEDLDFALEGDRSNYELNYIDPGGTMHQLLITATPRFDSTGKFIGSFAVIRDITDRKIVEEDLRYRSTHDALTGLPNRLLAKERMENAIRNAQENGTKTALLFIDLDGFKTVNDTLGHSAGDMMLKQVSNRLKECIRALDTLCRLGGDEFLLILSDINMPGMSGVELLIKAKKIRPLFPIGIGN